MNIRAGLFRLWIVASVLFIVAVGVASYSDIRNEFRTANTDWDATFEQYGGYGLLPALCDLARGSSGIDYTVEKDGLCWYKMQDFRRLYPEYRDLSNNVLAEKLYAKVGQPLQHFHPWHKVFKTAAIAVGVPVAVLFLGWSLLWALAGFRHAPASESLK